LKDARWADHATPLDAYIFKDLFAQQLPINLLV
jgi:hypothetical protein